MIKDLIDNKIWNFLLENSKDDVILQSIINKSESDKEFIHALIVGLLTIKERELKFFETLNEFMKSNPEIRELFESKKPEQIKSFK